MTLGVGVEFGILGPLTIRSDGTEVAVGAPKLRALLISLVLDVGRVVPTDRLVEDLWGEDATDQALVSLRSYVSNLRRLLPAPPERPLIVSSIRTKISPSANRDSVTLHRLDTDVPRDLFGERPVRRSGEQLESVARYGKSVHDQA